MLDYLKKLIEKKDKDSRIKANKINDYIEILSRYGTQAVSYTHLDVYKRQATECRFRAML